MIKVYDNFLPEYHFKQMQSVLLSEYMPWYHNEYIRDENQKGKYQFVHTFFGPNGYGYSQRYRDLEGTFNIILTEQVVIMLMGLIVNIQQFIILIPTMDAQS